MIRWKTQEIVDLLKDDRWDIEIESVGGDVDTEKSAA